ncbi:glycosyltransferase [Pedobacter sp. AW31-3R]|uniref:glycosyltransferase n=1 Tax=Pedobacter sp. AW31-3R TaxID=3445781 RepID=UPI003F9F4D8A
MNIVFFSNADFFGTQKRPEFSSMPRFTNMLAEGMAKRGHKVKIWSPRSRFFLLPFKGTMKKWMGYIDQYLLFPATVKKLLRTCSKDTLYVFTDQAQGPWVPLVANKHHVIHCHDFLSQLSAMDKIEECKTSWTGKKYQRFIRNGYRKGKHFICISNKTRNDLEELLPQMPLSSSVVYNGLDETYVPLPADRARALLKNKTAANLDKGYCLHIGGNQWYKNREGVVDIYNAWRSMEKIKLPLLLIGPPPSSSLAQAIEQSAFEKDIHAICNLSDEYVRYAYAGATVLLFPSLAEGFGWPIAEAMAIGCPVITTNEAPMTEVAGAAGFFIPRRNAKNKETWAAEGAKMLQKVIGLSHAERKQVVNASIHNARRFNSKHALDQIENIYRAITETPPSS